MQPLELEKDQGVPVSSVNSGFQTILMAKKCKKNVFTLFCLLTKNSIFAKLESEEGVYEESEGTKASYEFYV